MKKNMALMALTGILTLASCGTGPTPIETDACATVSACFVTVNLTGTTSAEFDVTVDGTTTTKTLSNGDRIAVTKSGTVTVTPKAKTGFNTPAAQSTAVSATNKTPTLGFTYTASTVSPVTQTVTINLTGGVTSAPVTIRDANGAIVAGYDNKATTSGATVSLAAGTYTVTAGEVTGFNKPAVQTVVVGTTATSVTLAYTRAISTNFEINPIGDAALNRKLTLEQNINGVKTRITYVRGNVVVVPNVNSGADRIEVFLSSTTNDLNAQNRIYDSRGGDTKGLEINTANLRQGELQYVVIRYWTGTNNTTESEIIIPDNLGPQVPDVIPVSELNSELTQRLGNYANGTIKLAFQNLATLRDNPDGTTVMPSGVERVEWYADSNAKNGVANFDTATLLGTSYNSPYEVNADTTKLKDGAYDVFAVAYDQLGNRSIVNAQNLFVLNVDNTGPVNGSGTFTAVDAGTGAVRDEFSQGGVTATYTRRPNATDYPVGVCKIDALNPADAGDIDLFDSVTTPAGRNYISGLAHVTGLTFNLATDGAGVGVSGTNNTVLVDGQPLVNRLYTLDAGGRLVPLAALRTVSAADCVYMDVNGLDANEVKIVFSSDASTDLLGNPATGTGASTSIFVDNQRPSNLRFSKKPVTVAANGQATLEAVADDSVSGLLGTKEFFARDTNGTAFQGRAVQLASADQTNYRFFQPTNATGKLDLIATVRDYAGNVSSTTDSVSVTAVGPQLVDIDQSNLFVRRQQANGQFLNFDLATNENPVRGPGGTVHSLDLLSTGTGVTPINTSNILAANFYKEILVTNPLNRIGKGTADRNIDDLNIQNTQAFAPLYLLSSTESAPYTSITPLAGGLFAYHAATIDKNGRTSNVQRLIQY